jgi:hypothetical protein
MLLDCQRCLDHGAPVQGRKVFTAIDYEHLTESIQPISYHPCAARFRHSFTILDKDPHRKGNKHTILIVQLLQKLSFGDTIVEEPHRGNSIFL